MKKLLLSLFTLLFVVGMTSNAYAPVVTDVPSSKNELVVKGSSPHVKYVDETGTGDFQTIVNAGVFKLDALSASKFFNVPNAGTFGIELDPPSTITVTSFLAGGSLADGTYFIKITALDLGGETIGSAEQTCLIAGGGGSGRCYCSWVASPPPAANYRVYVGSSPEGENKYFATGGAINYNLTTTAGTLGTPPLASTAYQVKLKNNGIHFPDGSTQLTAAGAGAWMFLGLDVLNTTNGNVGIFDGSVWTPDAKLTVKCSTASCGIDLNDSGLLASWAVDNIQLRSNYKMSTDRLWDTLKPSWTVALGDGGADRFVVYRAPATGGAPIHSPLLTLTTIDLSINPGGSPPFTLSGYIPTATILSPGSLNWRLRGLTNSSKLILDAGSPFGPELELDINSVKKAGFGTAATIPTETWLYYQGTLNFQSPYGSTLAYLNSSGTFHANATVDAGNNLTATNRVRGGAMGRSCAENVAIEINSDGYVNQGPPVTITTGGANYVYVHASVNGYFYNNTNSSMSLSFNLRRNDSVDLQVGYAEYYDPDNTSGGTRVPFSYSLESIDYPGTAAPNSYNIVSNSGGFDANHRVHATVRICAFEIP